MKMMSADAICCDFPLSQQIHFKVITIDKNMCLILFLVEYEYKIHFEIKEEQKKKKSYAWMISRWKVLTVCNKKFVFFDLILLNNLNNNNWMLDSQFILSHFFLSKLD